MIVLIAPLVASSPLGLSTGLLPKYLQQDLFTRSKLSNQQINMINGSKRHQMSNDWWRPIIITWRKKLLRPLLAPHFFPPLVLIKKSFNVRKNEDFYRGDSHIPHVDVESPKSTKNKSNTTAGILCLNKKSDVWYWVTRYGNTFQRRP